MHNLQNLLHVHGIAALLATPDMSKNRKNLGHSTQRVEGLDDRTFRFQGTETENKFSTGQYHNPAKIDPEKKHRDNRQSTINMLKRRNMGDVKDKPSL